MNTKKQFKDQLIDFYKTNYGVTYKEIKKSKFFNHSFNKDLEVIYWNNRNSKTFQNS